MTNVYFPEIKFIDLLDDKKIHKIYMNTDSDTNHVVKMFHGHADLIALDSYEENADSIYLGMIIGKKRTTSRIKECPEKIKIYCVDFVSSNTEYLTDQTFDLCVSKNYSGDESFVRLYWIDPNIKWLKKTFVENLIKLQKISQMEDVLEK